MIQQLKYKFYKRFRTSFAKSGEDIQMGQLLKHVQNGFYIDIGSHHPIFGNNTYYFYVRGWKGICIDPNPKFEPLYKKYRPEDKFLNIGIGLQNQALNYYSFSSDLLNTFSEKQANEMRLHHHLKEVIKVPVQPLSQVLEFYKIGTTSIDIMSIDAEGYDFEVVKSNDWQKFRPKYVLIETNENLSDDVKSEIVQFLTSNDYKLSGKILLTETIGTLIMKRTD